MEIRSIRVDTPLPSGAVLFLFIDAKTAGAGQWIQKVFALANSLLPSAVWEKDGETGEAVGKHRLSSAEATAVANLLRTAPKTERKERRALDKTVTLIERGLLPSRVAFFRRSQADER